MSFINFAKLSDSVCSYIAFAPLFLFFFWVSIYYIDSPCPIRFIFFYVSFPLFWLSVFQSGFFFWLSFQCTNYLFQFSSVTQSCLTLCDPMNRSTPGLPVHGQLPEPMSIESVMPSTHLILCPPLLLLPSIFPSIRVFSNESVLRIRWPKYWSFSFNTSPSNEHPGLISFWMDWLDLLAVQGTLKSLLQHHSSKLSF